MGTPWRRLLPERCQRGYRVVSITSVREQALDGFQMLVSDVVAAGGGSDELELAAEELRTAMRCLGKFTGAVDVEELLDVIFREFCVGK